MSPEPLSSRAANAALLQKIQADVCKAAELADYLALRGTQLAAAAPRQTTLADLRAAGRSVADLARSTSDGILLLLQDNQPGPPSHPGDTLERLKSASEWATTLDLQLKTAVAIHARICSELSNRAAVAEEWIPEGSQPQAAGARVLAQHARMLRDSVSR